MPHRRPDQSGQSEPQDPDGGGLGSMFKQAAATGSMDQFQKIMPDIGRSYAKMYVAMVEEGMPDELARKVTLEVVREQSTGLWNKPAPTIGSMFGSQGKP